MNWLMALGDNLQYGRELKIDEVIILL